MRRRRDKAVAQAATLVALLSPLVVVGCGGSGPADAARSYLGAWSRGDIASAARSTDNATAATQALTSLRNDLQLTTVRARLGHVASHGEAGTAEVDVSLALRGAGTWSYVTTVQLHRSSGHWLVHWTTTDINPAYSDGTRLTVTRTLPARADLLDDHGQPLFTQRAVVDVGLEPARLGARRVATIATVARVLHVDGKALTAAVAAAKPQDFVPVITLRRAAYDAVKPEIYSLPGTVFRAHTALLPPSTGFARALLGTVGPATADVLKAAGGAYRAGDVLGLSGLQEVFQQRLAGAASTSIVVLDRTGATVATLKTFAGHPGSNVRTTLDVATQQAAEAALAAEDKPAALVAVRVSDGALLAVANTPDATSYDRALSGRYPPGSTFKVVTTYALLGAGVTATTPVSCPPSITVDGKSFHNFEGEARSSPSFAEDFAVSCNTAFIGASTRVRPDAVPTAATALGLGAAWHLPLDAFSGSVPQPSGAVDKAAEAIGQGRVEVSPLAMALVAAAVASGRPHAPVLVTDPAQPAVTPLTVLDPSRVDALRSLMRLVVTSGTAAPAHLPGPTYGKTGTAEFGTGNPPQTHAWFIGYRGDLAFAVLVEGGGVGGVVAAPIAASFLRALP